ncbi:MAG: Crp/Fnr family transcriptional regulator [Gammaproteobacteria bacterium]|nr:Crp/Fnr family transcriptional regulator [Gammaproteobacteria bacterium]MBU1977565.1 Crp/Fnr family transcriptional regulator [Gammaproteobacteria bacterium]
MPDSHAVRQNLLLAGLPAAEFERLSPHLELVQMRLGDVLYESGGELRYVYFPTTCIISLLYVMEDGASVEIAGVGNEGVIGVALCTGGETMPNLAMVRCAGYAYRLKSKLLKEALNRGGGRRSSALQDLLLRYTQALITQISQIAVCNRHHSVEQQLCRWLLTSIDRSPSNELIVTQELIGHMLGVRREGITEAAGKLLHAGLISYRRGHITVLDRSGLEKRACECYQVVKTEFDRLLPDVVATQAVEPRCMRADPSASRDEKRATAFRPFKPSLSSHQME